jgi:hypothetical protein
MVGLFRAAAAGMIVVRDTFEVFWGLYKLVTISTTYYDCARGFQATRFSLYNGLISDIRNSVRMNESME